VTSKSFHFIRYAVALITASRRGLSSSPVTQLVIVNPVYPDVPSPHPTHYWVNHSPHPDNIKGDTVNETITLLKRRGIIAADFRRSSHKWSGMVRIPTKSDDGEWESRQDRVKNVQEHKGEFRRVDIL
jgi:hypothetical protein